MAKGNITFAREIVSVAHMPVMVTGGIRRYPVVEQVLGSGVAVAGMATALAIAPDLPARWHREQAASAELRPIPWRNKVLASVGYMAMVKYQLRRLGRGQPSRPKIAPALALACQQWQTLLGNARYRRWIKAQEK